jgi:hypothetical protein
MNGPKSDDCLNYTGGISKEPQSVGNKRKTARRKWSQRAVLILSRGNQTRLELFGSEFDGWPAKLTESMLEAV